MKRFAYFGLLVTILLSGCMGAARHKQAVQSDAGDRVTVGKVQKEIKVGMTGAQVIAALGSPNIVSTDEKRREVWVYDKIATDSAYSTSEGGATLILLGFGRSAGAVSTSQRTLTIVIKFDENKRVRDFSYHTSRF